MTPCPDHTEICEAVAVGRERQRAQEHRDAEIVSAVQRLDLRVRLLERQVAIWGGALTAVAALPWLIKLIEAVAPVATAVAGQ